MEILELINIGSKQLKNKKIYSHKLDSEILLSKVLNKTREELLINLNQEIGQQKDDLEIQPEASKNIDLMEIADFFKSKIFWIISLTFAFQFFAMGGVLLHLPLHSEKIGFIETFSFIGFPVKQYVFAYSLAAFGGVLGKVLFGYLIDKLAANKPVMLMMLMQSIGIFGLTISTSYGLFAVFCFIFGINFFKNNSRF